VSNLPNRQCSRRVAWAEWANGQEWELTPGVDHEQSARDALRSARMWALKHGFYADARLPNPRAPFGTPWVIRFRIREEARHG
jgi:hypothetical protein